MTVHGKIGSARDSRKRTQDSMWFVMNVEPTSFWPSRESYVTYLGRELILRPAAGRSPSSVAMECDQTMKWDRASKLVRQFLSALSWMERMPIRDTGGAYGTSALRLERDQQIEHAGPCWHADNLPEQLSKEARYALALYRDAWGLNSPAYQLLGFFKILNTKYRKGREQTNWINATIPLIKDGSATQRMVELRSQTTDIGDYLYRSGRCAVAHANLQPVVDPEDPREVVRLERDVVVVRALAEFLIENELGVKSQATIWHEHLYELQGFRRVLGAQIVSELKSGAKPDPTRLPALPRMSIRLRDYAPFASFENMAVKVIGIGSGNIDLLLKSGDGTLTARLGLDFQSERLRHEPLEDSLVLKDDGSVNAANSAMDRLRLIRGLILSGQLEVWDCDRAELLGRRDHYIAHDIDPTRTIENIDHALKHLGQVAAFRAEMKQVGTPANV